jgi:hypothetical protein
MHLTRSCSLLAQHGRLYAYDIAQQAKETPSNPQIALIKKLKRDVFHVDAMKAYGKGNVFVHPFLATMSGRLQGPATLPQGKEHLMGGCGGSEPI